MKENKDTRIVADKGTWLNRINTVLGTAVANLLGRLANYTLRFLSHYRRLPDFKNPRNLSECQLALMLQPEFLEKSKFADKYGVRDYIRQKGLGDILVPLLKVWDKVEDIDLSNLPDKFILKANNGCGGHLICTDKRRLKIEDVRATMRDALQSAHRLRNTEPHYSLIPPKIICEALLGDGDTLPSDYKFVCLNGEIAFILVVPDRKKDGKKQAMSPDWTPLDYVRPEWKSQIVPRRPECLEKMIDIAKTLSADFDLVRVDLYEHEGKIYFGELTMSPAGGIWFSFTDEALDKLGHQFLNGRK